MKSIVMSLSLIFASAPPLLAACTARGCMVGPCISADLVVDYSFSEGCTQWKWSSSAHRVYIKGWSAQLDRNSPSGRVYQDIDISNGYSSFDVLFSLEIEKCSTGGETLYIEIRRPSDDALLETIAALPATTASSGSYSRRLSSNYANEQIVRLTIRQVGGTGDTEFRVKEISFWGNV